MSEPSDATPAPAPVVSAGALLRAAREATGLHIAALAVSLKVPVRKIEALEADRWDELTDPVFVRALAGSACRALRVDPSTILALLPVPAQTRLVPSSSLATDFSQRSASPIADRLRPMGNPAVLAVLALLAAALLVYVWPNAPETVPSGEVAKSMSTAAVPTSMPQASTLMAAGKDGSTGQMPDASAMAAPLAPTASASPVTTETVVRAPALALANGESGSVPIISFKAKDSSWVEVVDARQTVLMRRIVNAGESASAAGELPLAVVVGRADAIEVQVRGQSFDLLARARDNVARFEVK